MGGAHQVVEDLVPDDLDHLEGRHGRDRVDQHVAMDADEVLRVQDAVFVLAAAVSQSVVRRAVAPCARTWPAVSTISVAYSWPRYLISLLKVFSMVG